MSIEARLAADGKDWPGRRAPYGSGALAASRQ
jgi:hypothetical protein